jgi:pyruvate dehydrogenase E2 component (dihydrolipoamide acetyltransferase)
MATAVIMPKQGQSVETCIISKWFRNKGEKVSAGDILCSYETDKAAFDLESPADGILLERFFEDGDEVPVLTNVAVIGKEGESIDSFKPGNSKEIQQDTFLPKNEQASSIPVSEKENVTNVTNSRIRISPRAKNLAETKGINYNNLKGTGPNGRIISSDIEKAVAALPGASSASNVSGKITGLDYTEQPLSNIRRMIAKAMHSSLQNSAQLTHHMSADARGILETRQKIKSKLATEKNQQDITLNDMVCWCVIRALEKFPETNSHFLGETIRTFSKIHLGLAVDTQRGLMVPALKNAGDMNLPALSRELKSLADACKKGNISPELLQSTAGTFTVSNLGNYGVEMFTPVINLPQAGILGVCTIINRPVDFGNHTFGFIPYIGLSLTYDHRAIDGGPATLFLKEIKEQIENFSYQV